MLTTGGETSPPYLDEAGGDMTEQAPGSLYRRLAGLGLEIDGYRTERRELDVSSGFRRVTTEIVLTGVGLEGRGEDVTYAAEDHDDYPADLPLAGEWTLDGFSRRVGGLDLFPGRPPGQEFFRPYRRWGFESAALDLALRQQNLSLGKALARPYRPVRFVLSTRLDIKPWLAVAPRLEFKLDPTPEWDESLMREIAATGRVRQLDFKSFYTDLRGQSGRPGAVPAGRGGVPGRRARGPGAGRPGARCAAWGGGALQLRRAHPLLGGRRGDDRQVAAVCGPGCDGFVLRNLNIKPSRFGSVRALLDCVERAQAAGMVLYGGGQFELGIGRDEIQALASLLYADGPNDVAPREYHGEAHPGVPPSPLVALEEQGPGFGFCFAV